jgi:hypothetical protein
MNLFVPVRAEPFNFDFNIDRDRGAAEFDCPGVKSDEIAEKNCRRASIPPARSM